MDKKVFPSELDNFQKPIRSFLVSKTFDSKYKALMTKIDYDKIAKENEEEVLTRTESLKKQKLDMYVDFPFNVNYVNFNSGLNADFIEAMQSVNEFDLVQPFVADYEINHRQFAFYVIECEVVDCDNNWDKLNKLADLVKDTPISISFSDRKHPLEYNNLAKDIRKAVVEALEKENKQAFSLGILKNA